jgi:hypothetical protein
MIAIDVPVMQSMLHSHSPSSHVVVSTGERALTQAWGLLPGEKVRFCRNTATRDPSSHFVQYSTI